MRKLLLMISADHITKADDLQNFPEVIAELLIHHLPVDQSVNIN